METSIRAGPSRKLLWSSQSLLCKIVCRINPDLFFIDLVGRFSHSEFIPPRRSAVIVNVSCEIAAAVARSADATPPLFDAGQFRAKPRPQLGWKKLG